VLIDEYQDTNHAQFVIAHALAAEHKNLCVTGDPDQSIYGWRGANIRNILDFEEHYPEAQVVRLEQNYRSTGQILKLADALIRQNRARKHKELWTELGEGEPATLATCDDERDEARWLVEQLQDQHDQNQIAWGQMAVFYRMNSLSRVLEDELRQAGVPYQIARGTAFYDRAEVKNAVAYLRAIVNPADEVSLFRIINTPTRGISDKTVKAMQAMGVAQGLSIDRIIEAPESITAVNARAQTAVSKFGKMLESWRVAVGLAGDEMGEAIDDDVLRTRSLRSFVEDVLRESGLEEYYRNDKSDPDHERLYNLGELVTFAQQFEEEYVFEQTQEAQGEMPTLAEKLLALLERIALVSDVDGVDPDQGAVTLMTLHSAKGLEYPVVAIVGVEDGLLPHERSQGDDQEIEEERRLLFVGITRAMRTLLLSHARYRTIFGRTSPTIPSRFINELPEEALSRTSTFEEEGDGEVSSSEPGWGASLGDRSTGRRQRSLAARQAALYPPGCVVRHPQFGMGRVIDVSPMGSSTRARVQFNTVGRKTLILQYARLERVSEDGSAFDPTDHFVPDDAAEDVGYDD